MPFTQDQSIKTCYISDSNIIEIGVDEVGRGPLFGRVYTAGVILSKDNPNIDYTMMKDSKKFTSEKKLRQAYEYIKDNCIDYVVNYESEETIDDINILQATQKSMHKCVQQLIERNNLVHETTLLLIDGNYFKPHEMWNKETQFMESFQHECVKGGDALYSSIAAASIIAKVSRDDYIIELCKENPELDERYSLSSNKGYGSKKHRDGIKEYGITQWHRKTFGICKTF